MLLGIGIDLIESARFIEIEKQFGTEKLLDKFCSLKEKNEFLQEKKSPASFVAKRFCAKEAFSKALGIGLGRGVDLRDITYTHDNLGKPIMELDEKANKFVKKLFDCEKLNIMVSSTDTEKYMSCVVVIEKI